MIHLEATRNRDRILIIENGKLNPNLPFSRGSTGTRGGASGLIVTDSNNVPRFEYSALSVYMGLLIEEARTNLILQSQSIGNSAWTKNGGGTGSAPVVTDNYAVSPDGTANASRVVLNIAAGTTSADLSQIQPTSMTTVTNGSTYTLTYWAKTNNGATVGVFVVDITGNGFFQSVTPVWKRYIRSITAITSSVFSFRIRLRGNEATSKSADLAVWGIQLELGSSATSYMPTGGSSVTRSADVAQATLSTIGISTTQGTFVIEHDVPSGQPLIYSGSNAILISTGAGKVAIGYDGAGWSKSVNGAAVTTSGTALTFSTTLDIGKSSTTSANGRIRRLTWYKAKRANSELQALS